MGHGLSSRHPNELQKILVSKVQYLYNRYDRVKKEEGDILCQNAKILIKFL